MVSPQGCILFRIPPPRNDFKPYGKGFQKEKKGKKGKRGGGKRKKGKREKGRKKENNKIENSELNV